MFRIPTISVFSAVNAVGYISFVPLSTIEVCRRNSCHLSALCASSRSRVPACGDLSLEFTMRSVVCQGYLPSSLIFNFAVEVVIGVAPSTCEDSGFDIHSDGELLDS